ARIPAFDLAVWLFRSESLNVARPAELRSRLLQIFHINDDERAALFDTASSAVPSWLSPDRLGEEDLLRVIGIPPPGAMPHGAATLRYLTLNAIGPAQHFRYEPGERLNLITGDNSLGKTFVLECIWWALTGTWLDAPAIPTS